ncbi:Wzz/FepE/Etk N-terminal domain-containing protein [Thermovibrio sp.]
MCYKLPRNFLRGVAQVERGIDLYEIWLTLKKRWRAVALSLLLFTFVALLYAFLSPPVYQDKHYFSEPLSPSVPT